VPIYDSFASLPGYVQQPNGRDLWGYAEAKGLMEKVDETGSAIT
jgi:hypothetical protein